MSGDPAATSMGADPTGTAAPTARGKPAATPDGQVSDAEAGLLAVPPNSVRTQRNAVGRAEPRGAPVDQAVQSGATTRSGKTRDRRADAAGAQISRRMARPVQRLSATVHRTGVFAMRPVHRVVGIAAVPAILLVLVQIAYPLTHGVGRDRVTMAVVGLSATTALVHAGVTRGVRWAAGLLVIVSGIGLLAEVVGTATGVPFGAYEYAGGRLGPEVAGVPLVVPLAWTGGIYPVWVVAGLLTSRESMAGPARSRTGVTQLSSARASAAELSSSRAVVRISLTALGAVGWDLFLDPQLVADGQWRWTSGAPGLPGLGEIPYTNYLGWLAVALVMGGLLQCWDRTAADTRQARVVPVAVFLWTWLGSTLAHAVFLGLPVSAMYGFIGLGVLGIVLVRGLMARRITLRPLGHGTM